MSKKYEELEPARSLCTFAARDAIVACGVEWPVLHVNACDYGVVSDVIRTIPMEVKFDPTLERCEWYIEFNGKRAGSNP